MTGWYKDKFLIDWINLKVEIDDQVEKENYVASLNIISKYSYWKSDWIFNQNNIKDD